MWLNAWELGEHGGEYITISEIYILMKCTICKQEWKTGDFYSALRQANVDRAEIS